MAKFQIYEQTNMGDFPLEETFSTLEEAIQWLNKSFSPDNISLVIYLDLGQGYPNQFYIEELTG